jgi:hypothetical protein
VQLFVSVAVYVIIVVPDASPVTTPVDAFIVAADGLELVQMPPLGLLPVNCNIPPVHTVSPPDMLGVGRAFTVMLIVVSAVQPFASVTLYVIFVTPAVTPVTVPSVFIVATPVFKLDHVRLLPSGVPDNVSCEPMHTEAGFGDILGTSWLYTCTFADVLAVQPFSVTVYVIVTVPGFVELAVTKPDVLTVALDVLALDHVWLLPVGEPDNCSVPPAHIPPAFDMLGDGSAFTVIFTCAVPLQPFVVAVYVTVAEPAVMPAVISPVDASIDTMNGLELVHVPPLGLLPVNCNVEPVHTVLPPDMLGVILALTVTVIVSLLAEPQVFVATRR